MQVGTKQKQTQQPSASQEPASLKTLIGSTLKENNNDVKNNGFRILLNPSKSCWNIEVKCYEKALEVTPNMAPKICDLGWKTKNTHTMTLGSLKLAILFTVPTRLNTDAKLRFANTGQITRKQPDKVQ